MFRRRATAIRANGAKDELVRETRRLGDLVTVLPDPEPEATAEVAREIDGATSEIDRIDALTETLEHEATGAAVSSLADAAAAARARRRRLRSIRRRLLADQGELAA